MMHGLWQLLAFQALGELLSQALLPRIPGPVLGLVALLLWCVLRRGVPRHIDSASQGLLQHLGLLFVPASVGVVLYLPVLRAHAWAIGTALVVSVVLTIASTALLLKRLSHHPTPPPTHGDPDAH